MSVTCYDLLLPYMAHRVVRWQDEEYHHILCIMEEHHEGWPHLSDVWEALTVFLWIHCHYQRVSRRVFSRVLSFLHRLVHRETRHRVHHLAWVHISQWGVFRWLLFWLPVSRLSSHQIHASDQYSSSPVLRSISQWCLLLIIVYYSVGIFSYFFT